MIQPARAARRGFVLWQVNIVRNFAGLARVAASGRRRRAILCQRGKLLLACGLG